MKLSYKKCNNLRYMRRKSLILPAMDAILRSEKMSQKGYFAMKERGEYILYLLSRSEKPMCTSELAELMSISTRTVKMEMNDLRGELPQHGAELIAKRNYGYGAENLQ